MLPLVDGLSVVKPPYSRVTAIDLNQGTLRWTTPFGNGPRSHPRLAHLNLPELGAGYRGAPLATRSLLFVSMGQGSLGIGRTVPLGNEPLSAPVPPEPQKLMAFDKATGAVLWEASPSGRPIAAPMTYLNRGIQYIVVATGLGPSSELVAYALER
jgi:quinoprotein glucose dehydrogenase